jgi:molybdopterin/thiamine biosynthesis adenylyltransferase
MHVYVIGCGGGASYLLPPLYRTLGAIDKSHKLYLIDRDTLEARNRRRQNFQAHQDGFSKAQALKQLLEESVYFSNVEIIVRNEYVKEDTRLELSKDPAVIFAMVDNHPARRSALAIADRYGIPCICAANEMHSAEAYYYDPNHYDTQADPRVVYPEILTDNQDDPTRPSCNEAPTGDKPVEQGAAANFLSAAAALHLFQAHCILGDALSGEYREYLPFMIRMSSYGMECINFRTQLAAEQFQLQT